MYTLIPSKFFLEQLDDFCDKTKRIISDKLRLVKINPFRYKRVYFGELFLFSIRFKDSDKSFRIIYLLEGDYVKIVCVLNRSKGYKDLEKYLGRVR